MIKVYLCENSYDDFSRLLSEQGLFFHNIPLSIDQLPSAQIVVELDDSHSGEFAELIATWLRIDPQRSATIRRDAEMVNGANLSVAALVYLLKTSSDVHLVDVRQHRIARVDGAHQSDTLVKSTSVNTSNVDDAYQL
jgi:hypothetical protein